MTKYISEKHEQTKDVFTTVLSTDDIYEHIKQTFDEEPSKEQVEEIYNNWDEEPVPEGHLASDEEMSSFWETIEGGWENRDDSTKNPRFKKKGIFFEKSKKKSKVKLI